MSVFAVRIVWTRASDRSNPVVVTDCVSASINKTTEIQNNICRLTLKNALTSFVDPIDAGYTAVGEYVDPSTRLIKFGQDDTIEVWADFISDASLVDGAWYGDDNSLGSFGVKEFSVQSDEGAARITVSAADAAFLLFNAVKTKSYGIGNKFTAPGIVRQICREFSEDENGELGTHNDTGTRYLIDAKFVSEGGTIEDVRRQRTGVDPDVYSYDATTTLSSSVGSSDVTINVGSTAGFQSGSDGTIVIGTEHIAYSGVTATSFTGCTRGIDDTTASSHSSGDVVYQGFPSILMSKIWKPTFEWLGELAQTQNTNYLSEVQEGSSLYYGRAFLFWIDKDNRPNFLYPDDLTDQTITLGEEGRRSFRLTKSVYDAINFIIYNCGEDMYGNGCLHYLFDDTGKVTTLKMRYQPMSKIIPTLIDEDRKVNTSRVTTNQDIYKQFPLSYPVVPSFLADANKFRATLGQGARTNVASDSDYNDCLREAAKNRGFSEAKKIVRNRTGLRWRGQVVNKGVALNPGDLVVVTNPFVGLSDRVRVVGVTHNITPNSWETILDLEEDAEVEE